jgi:hypothetical protein
MWRVHYINEIGDGRVFRERDHFYTEASLMRLVKFCVPSDFSDFVLFYPHLRELQILEQNFSSLNYFWK